MNTRSISLAITAVMALPLSGCLSTVVLLRNNAREDRGYYDFHEEQTQKLVALRDCPAAATYFMDRFEANVTKPILARRELSSEERKELFAKREKGAAALSATCLDEVAPSLLADNQYDELKGLYLGIIALAPDDAGRREELKASAKGTDALKSAYLFEQSAVEWERGDAERALEMLGEAITMAGVAGDAERRAAATDRRAQYAREYAAKLVEIADAHGREPNTQHLAMLEYGRAHQLVPGAATKKKFESLRATIFSSNTYSYSVSVRLDGASESRVKDVLSDLSKHVRAKSYASVKRSAPDGVTLSVSVGKPSFSDRTATVSLTHDYVDGTKPAPNPKLEDIQDEIARLQRDIRSKQDSIARTKCDSTDCTAADRDSLASYQKQLARAQEKLADTPKTVQVPNNKTHTYSAKRTTYTVSAPVTIKCAATPYDEAVSKDFTYSTSRDRYPANRAVKLSGSSPSAPSRGSLDGSLLAKVSSSGKELLDEAIQVRLNQQVDAQKQNALAAPEGAARDGMVFRWLMFMPNEAARSYAIDALPPAQRQRAEELRGLAASMQGERLLQPSSREWKQWVDDGFGRE